MALLIAVTGLYGAVAYVVELRQPELAVRSAIGATRDHLLAVVLRDLRTMVGLGTLGGILVGVAAQRVVGAALGVEVEAVPWFIVGTVTCIAVIVIAAASLPVLRIARLDPSDVLRRTV